MKVSTGASRLMTPVGDKGRESSVISRHAFRRCRQSSIVIRHALFFHLVQSAGLGFCLELEVLLNRSIPFCAVFRAHPPVAFFGRKEAGLLPGLTPFRR